MKKLLPSLREKKRYVVYEILSDKGVNAGQAREAIYNNLLKMMGEIELGRAGMQILPDYTMQRGIIKISNKYVDTLKASFALMEKINNNKVIVASRGVSGAINKARSKFMWGV